MSEKPVAVRYADEVEAHAATKAELSKLQNEIAAKVKAMDEKDEEIKRLKDENEELKKKIEQYEEQDKEKDAKHSQEVADLSAKLTDVTAKLALSPAHNDVSAGAAPVSEVASGDAPKSWPEAMKLCGDNYVLAATKFPNLLDAFLAKK